MHSMVPSAVSKSFSPWCVVSVGDAALLLLAMARGAPLGTGISLGDASAPQTPVLDLGQPSWLQAAIGMYPSSR